MSKLLHSKKSEILDAQVNPVKSLTRLNVEAIGTGDSCNYPIPGPPGGEQFPKLSTLGGWPDSKSHYILFITYFIRLK